MRKVLQPKGDDRMAEIKPRVPTEEEEQITLFRWAEWMAQVRWPELAMMYHVPNGGKRDAREAARFKAMGVKPGVPDLCIPVPRGGYAGLYIEMKYGKNKPTDNQKKWISRLREYGHKVEVCYSGIEATEVIEEYMKSPRTILMSEEKAE